MNKCDWRLQYCDSLTFKYGQNHCHCKKVQIYCIRFSVARFIGKTYELLTIGLSQVQSSSWILPCVAKRKRAGVGAAPPRSFWGLPIPISTRVFLNHFQNCCRHVISCIRLSLLSFISFGITPGVSLGVVAAASSRGNLIVSFWESYLLTVVWVL